MYLYIINHSSNQLILNEIIMIKLRGELDYEITRFGVKSGDVIKQHTTPGKVDGAVSFDVRYGNFTQSCVVWPDNYEMIQEKEKDVPVHPTEINSLKASKVSEIACDLAQFHICSKYDVPPSELVTEDTENEMLVYKEKYQDAFDSAYDSFYEMLLST